MGLSLLRMLPWILSPVGACLKEAGAPMRKAARSLLVFVFVQSLGHPAHPQRFRTEKAAFFFRIAKNVCSHRDSKHFTENFLHSLLRERVVGVLRELGHDTELWTLGCVVVLLGLCQGLVQRLAR